MKYDDASRHFGGDFPADLPHGTAATYTGIFVTWAFLSGLAGSMHVEDFPGEIASLRERRVTPAQFFLSSCDGKFTDEDLTTEGNAFATTYFDFKMGP